ncbi:MAG: hypothetical protein JWR51_4049 [Devosia sp.]|uniref:hypothetical protein n=1 Tax=Devosia sp. TaxID=1871048 RepID=UPI002620AFFC|nr:hypothetical protein [Devosia sp.]MDB5530946.1 hypothetical protein [Devosia sp.]
MSDTRTPDVPLGIAERLFVKFLGKIHCKINVDEHRDVLFAERKSKNYIVIKESYPGNTYYSYYSVNEFRHLEACVNNMLAALPPSEIAP